MSCKLLMFGILGAIILAKQQGYQLRTPIKDINVQYRWWGFKITPNCQFPIYKEEEVRLSKKQRQRQRETLAREFLEKEAAKIQLLESAIFGRLAGKILIIIYLVTI